MCNGYLKSIRLNSIRGMIVSAKKWFYRLGQLDKNNNLEPLNGRYFRRVELPSWAYESYTAGYYGL